MENRIWFNECVEMLEKLEVLRSFMSQNSKKRLKKACRGNEIKYLLSRKNIAELVDDSKSKSTGRFILKCDKPNIKYVVTDSNVLAQLLKNSRYLLKKDLPMN